jgi:hypothetical protein
VTFVKPPLVEGEELSDAVNLMQLVEEKDTAEDMSAECYSLKVSLESKHS